MPIPNADADADVDAIHNTLYYIPLFQIGSRRT